MPPDGWSGIPVREETRDRVRNLKRGGISYTELIEKMADQYDPDSHEEGDD